MIEIIPAIMPKDYDDLTEKVDLVSNKALSVQLDLMDGEFVEATTWPFFADFDNDMADEKDKLKQIDVDVLFELDLMVENASEMIPHWCRTGAGRLIFHIEAEQSLVKNLEAYQEQLKGVELGLAFDDDYPVQSVIDLVPYFDFVQCMGIDEIGKQGEAFEPRVLENLKTLRTEFPELILSVDGSVNANTAKSLTTAGANRLVVGSAVFAAQDPIAAIVELENLVQ